jgi:hypothetical protein
MYTQRLGVRTVSSPVAGVRACVRCPASLQALARSFSAMQQPNSIPKATAPRLRTSLHAGGGHYPHASTWRPLGSRSNIPLSVIQRERPNGKRNGVVREGIQVMARMYGGSAVRDICGGVLLKNKREKLLERGRVTICGGMKNRTGSVRNGWLNRIIHHLVRVFPAARRRVGPAP